VKENHFLSRFDFIIIIKQAANKLEFDAIKTDLQKLFARAKITEV
jgi:ribonuclease P protein component